MLDTRENQLRRNRQAARHRRVVSRHGVAVGSVRSQAVALVCVAGSILLWTVGFAGTDPDGMGELGLLSEFNTAIVAAIVLLLGSTLVCIFQHRPGWVLGTHLVTYLTLLHGTPAVLYETVRYSWSYKHIGVVEYILRTGSVDPGIDTNQIYHNWPGLFAASAVVADLGGEGAANAVALWAPLGFNLMLLVVLRYLFRGFTGRRAVVWLALLIYFTITWVGQDYYSPQAAVYILYIGMIGLLVRNRRGGVMRTLVFSVLVAAMAVTHQITLVILVMAVVTLVVTRQTRGWYLPVIAVAIVCIWALTFAGDYTIYNFNDLVSGFGQPLSNAEATFSKSDGASDAQRLVVWGDRFTVAAAAAFALLGVWRTRRSGTLHWAPVVLMFVPVAVLVQMSFGGESLLRVFLFSAPFIAYLAAEACAPRAGSDTFDRRRFHTAVLALVVVVPGFLLGYYGKERYHYFTEQEVAASQWLSTNAPTGSLLVEGDVNYPRQFHDYEKFTYVPIAFEPSAARLLSRPEVTLHDWLSDPRYTDGFVVITRSQKIGVDMYGSFSAEALTELEEALAVSPLFRVAHHSRDATVFTLSAFGRWMADR